jgi:hypothetical protein
LWDVFMLARDTLAGKKVRRLFAHSAHACIETHLLQAA